MIKVAEGENLLIVPGDGDISEENINNMFRNINHADMVFLYFLNKEMRGRIRNIISMIYNVMHLLVFDVYIQYISGPCIYPMARLKQLKLKSKRLSIVSEISIKLLYSDCTYCEVSGNMQRGKSGSTTISLQNFLEVTISFIKLLIDIKIINRKLYNKRSVRIQ